MVGDTSGLNVHSFTALEHVMQHIHRDLQRDMQIKIMLLFEIERAVGGFEEGEERPIVHFVKTMQNIRFVAGHGFPNSEGVGEGQAEKAFIELPSFFRITAPIGVVMKSIDRRVHSFKDGIRSI